MTDTPDTPDAPGIYDRLVEYVRSHPDGMVPLGDAADALGVAVSTTRYHASAAADAGSMCLGEAVSDTPGRRQMVLVAPSAAAGVALGGMVGTVDSGRTVLLTRGLPVSSDSAALLVAMELLGAVRTMLSSGQFELEFRVRAVTPDSGESAVAVAVAAAAASAPAVAPAAGVEVEVEADESLTDESLVSAVRGLAGGWADPVEEFG